MTWAGRRKLFYGGLLCIFIALFLLAKLYPKLTKDPTCMDQKQNGAERGIDCGGGCIRICQAETTPLVVKWSRSFKVADGIYNAFAYVENQNIRAAAPLISYEFTLYDTNNIFITSRTGTVYVPPNGRFGIFEAGIDTGKRVPKNTSIKLLNVPDWLTIGEEEAKQSLFAEADAPTNLDISPRLNVTIENPTISTVRNIEVYAIVYAEDGNALGVSKTIMDALPAGGKRNTTFTWREPFAGEPKRTEIITQLNVFSNRQ
jgi:hypothetical protein